MKKLAQQALAASALAMLCLGPASHADEGMWTLHSPPVAQVKAKYGYDLTPEFLRKLRAASIKFGSSSAAVSPNGLLLTNHHVALGCIQRLSSAENDLVAKGFLARVQADEKRCPGSEATQLVSFEEVTPKIVEARDAKARQASIALIEKQCRDSTKLRCNVVTLFRGGQYWLYRYKVWRDVRLVWAPERALGFFGGDADNFVYPRFNLDATIVRVYENDKPASTPDFLPFSRRGVEDGELIFAVGNPGSTDRSLTIAELMYQRDQAYPIRLTNTEDRRDSLVEFGKSSPEAARRAAQSIFGIENTMKAARGEHKRLMDERVLQRLRGDESALKSAAGVMMAKGELPPFAEIKLPDGNTARDPWSALAAIAKIQHQRAFESSAMEMPFGTLLGTAMQIVALANETVLPEADRLLSYSDSRVALVTRQLSVERPIYQDAEEARLAQKIDEAMSYVGQAHPFVAKMLIGETPKLAAAKHFAATKLNRAAERRALVEGGIKAVAASSDSLIQLARELYPAWRTHERWNEINITALKERAHAQIAAVRFKQRGTSIPPDATGTMRISYGRVAGFDREGIANPWTTTFYGLYDRNVAFGNKGDYALPANWTTARDKLNLATPFNFVSTLDIIGGNSGSPAINRAGELVGVLFDGNLDGLGNRFQYQERNARALAVDVRAIIEALDKVYGAKELLGELALR